MKDKSNKHKFYNDINGKSADIQRLPASNLYKLLTYPGKETYLPGVEFFQTKEEAIEAARKWIDKGET